MGFLDQTCNKKSKTENLEICTFELAYIPYFSFHKQFWFFEINFP